jgi:assimilatory nitrate reductase catalytic subunit
VAAHTDPASGQPESKFTPVQVMPYGAAWYGYAVLRDRPALDGDLYWAAAPLAGGWQVELAGSDWQDDWLAFASGLAGCKVRAEDCLVFHDSGAGLYRLAIFEGDRPMAALFVSREPVAVSRSWAIERLSATFTPAMRMKLLAGRAAGAAPEKGAILCSCMNVGVNEIAAAIARGAHSPAAVGEATGAGTNCGSCRAEIDRLIDACALQAAE